jgi:invasion protein IalB
MRIAMGFVLVAALGAAADAQSPTPAPATQVPPAQIVISGWRLECNTVAGSLQCLLLDQVTARSNNAVISAISIRRANDGKSSAMVVQVPLGTAVDDAVRVGFENGAVQTLPFYTCNRSGCFARAAVGEPVLSAMRAAKQPLRIAYETLDTNGAKQTVTISLGLDGFSSAYDRLR